ncbi:MAG: SusC/RagA family TonB-linked outer membrane protein [Saprospiraceae bacterium]
MKKLTLVLVMLFASLSLLLAQRTITGKVSDEKGEAIVGANVLVKGTSVGAATDVDGNYRIAVPAGSNVLVFSYIGFTDEEVSLGASNVVDIRLQENSKVLTDVVVTALGIAKKDKSIGYGVSKVSGAAVSSSGEINAVQGLAAKASGVQIVGSAGVPGASSKILIRGNSTFTGENQPLFVVDGVPFDNQTNSVVSADYPFNANLQGINESNRALDINPNDIENISILKGPSASALYGTRAANGVVLITTKSGKKGLSVDYGVQFDLSEVNKMPEYQTAYGQGNGGGLKNATTGLINETGTYAATTPNSWGPKAANVFDNNDNYFRKGQSWANNFSISGGNDRSSVRFSYRNDDQEGIIPNTFLKRNTFRVNATTGTDQLKVTTSVAYTNTNARKAQNGSNLSGIMLPLLRMPVDFNIIGGAGTGGYETAAGKQHTYLGNYDNPLWTAYHNPQDSRVNRLSGNVKFDYMPADWLTFTYRIGTDMYNDVRKQIFDIGSNNIGSNGELWESNNKHEEVNSDFFITAKKTVGDLGGSLTVGNQLNQRYDQSIFSRGRDLTIPGFFNLRNATTLYADETNTTRRIAGMFFSLDLDYKNFLYLNVAGRNDWASTFGPQAKKSFFYPTASLSAVLSEILPKNDIMTFLKVRGSFARAGREPGAYSSRTYFVKPFITDGFTDGFGFPYKNANGFSISNVLGNPALRPEINTSYEAGIDAKFLKNKITAAVTYYNSLASDLLVARPLASTSGFQAVNSNTGEMRNSGIEADLDINVLNTNGFSWNIGGVFTKNVSEVLKLAEGVDQISLEAAFTGIGSYAIVGQPYGAIFGGKWSRNAAGQLIIGANGLPNRDAAEGYIGNPFPKWTAGIRNTFSYKGLRLFALLDIREGGDLWGGTVARLNRIGKMAETGKRSDFYVIDGVKADGSKNDIKITPQQYFGTYKGDGAGSASENAIFSGGWVRLREVTLTYTLPSFAKVLKNAEIYVTGRNLWLKTNYPGVDPETSLTGAGSNIGGFDYFNMPGARSYIVGLRTSF